MGTSISHSNICTTSVESRVNIYHSQGMRSRWMWKWGIWNETIVVQWCPGDGWLCWILENLFMCQQLSFLLITSLKCKIKTSGFQIFMNMKNIRIVSAATDGNESETSYGFHNRYGVIVPNHEVDRYELLFFYLVILYQSSEISVVYGFLFAQIMLEIFTFLNFLTECRISSLVLSQWRWFFL